MTATSAVIAENVRVVVAADPTRLVVRDVSFAVPSGGALGIAGESGSGKTALIHALFGYSRAGLKGVRGSIYYHVTEQDALPVDQPALFAPVRGRVVAMIPQSPQAMLDPIMAVGEQLLEVVDKKRIDRREAVLATLRDVGFANPDAIMQRYPHQLSGGQRQRIAISFALLLSPHVLVLDEATTDLDVVTQKTILDLIKKLQRERGFAVVAVSHDLRVLRTLCDDLLILYAGRTVESGPLAAIMDQPRHPYTASLVERFTHGPLGGLPRSPYAVASSIGSAACAYISHCSLATEKCQDEPELLDVGVHRRARCWHFDRVPPTTASVGIDPGLARQPTGADAVLKVSHVVASHREPGLLNRHSTQVLNDINLELRERECLAIVGESGSGKSTLARVIVGLHPPDSGEVLYCGKPLASKAAQRDLSIRKDIQIVFQNPETAFNPTAKIGDVLGRRLRMFEATPRAKMADRLAELLAEVGLSPAFLDRRPSALSGGEKQRLAIARALIGSPKILLCDEVVSSLDVETQARIVQLLVRLQRDRGMSSIFISHDLSVVASLAHRIAVMKNGNLVEIDDSDAIMRGGRDPYTRQLVESAFAHANSDARSVANRNGAQS